MEDKGKNVGYSFFNPNVPPQNNSGRFQQFGPPPNNGFGTTQNNDPFNSNFGAMSPENDDRERSLTPNGFEPSVNRFDNRNEQPPFGNFSQSDFYDPSSHSKTEQPPTIMEQPPTMMKEQEKPPMMMEQEKPPMMMEQEKEESKMNLPPSTLEYEVSPSVMEEENRFDTSKTNFGFTATHGVPYEHGPNNNPNNVTPRFEQPPRYQEPPSNIDNQRERINSGKTTNVISHGYYGNGGSDEASPNHCPHPTSGSFNYVHPQPDTKQLFYRVSQGMPRVNMNHTQASPCFIRPTMHCAPAFPNLLTKFALPFGTIITPFADTGKVQEVHMGFTEIVRCRNCRSYINPFCVFIDRGYKWRCNLCKNVNDVPKCYHSQLNEHGIRSDLAQRKELRYGSVEFIAPKRYHTRLQFQPTSFAWCIDTSYHSIVSGAFKTICESILENLDHLPSKDQTRVSLITFDKTIGFYSLVGSKPKIFMIGELEQSLLPLPSRLFMKYKEAKQCLKKLLKLLPTKIFPKPKAGDDHYLPSENCMFSALKSAQRLLSRFGGKIQVFLSSMPTIGTFKLRPRGGGDGEPITNSMNPMPSNHSSSILEKEKVGIVRGSVEKIMSKLPAEDEHALLRPVSTDYKDYAIELSKDTISVDLFILDGSLTGAARHTIGEGLFDLATLQCLPRYTGGHLFSCDDHSTLRLSIKNSIRCIRGFDAVLRVRVSTGLKTSNFHGNFFVKGHDLLSIPYVDSLQSFGIELEHDGKSLATANACIQAAMLYTLPNGERRIRVHNLTLPITQKLSDLYMNSDIAPLMTLLTKKWTDDLPRKNFKFQRVQLMNRIVRCMQSYRKEVRVSSMEQYNQIVLADNIRLLPLLTLALYKNFALVERNSFYSGRLGGTNEKQQRGGQQFVYNHVTSDLRIQKMRMIGTSTSPLVILELYPEIYEVGAKNEPKQQEKEKEEEGGNKMVFLSRQFIKENRFYVVNNGTQLIAWLTGACQKEFLDDLNDIINKLNRYIFPQQKKKKQDEDEESDGDDSDDDSEEEDESKEEDEEEEEEPIQHDHALINDFIQLVDDQRTKYKERELPVTLVTPSTNKMKHEELLMKLIEDPNFSSSGEVSVYQKAYDKFLVEIHRRVVSN